MLRPVFAKMMKKLERRSHCKLAWMLTNLLLAAPPVTIASPVIIRGMPPHWAKKPHKELTPAIMTMFVAGSFLPPPHQGLLLPRSLLLTSSLLREFGGSSFLADSIHLFSSSLDAQLVHHHHHHLHLQHLLLAWVLACRCQLLGPFSP